MLSTHLRIFSTQIFKARSENLFFSPLLTIKQRGKIVYLIGLELRFVYELHIGQERKIVIRLSRR